MIDLYEQCLTLARIAASGYGYAIALHGSAQRDLDLIAIPWTEDARHPAHMVLAIISALQFELGFERVHVDSGVLRMLRAKAEGEIKEHSWHSTATKPHGRAAIVINIGASFYIDLSIMPRKLSVEVQENGQVHQETDPTVC